MFMSCETKNILRNLTFGMTKMPSVFVGCFSNASSVSNPRVSSPNTCHGQDAQIPDLTNKMLCAHGSLLYTAGHLHTTAK